MPSVRTVQSSRLISAPAEDVFELLARPSQHSLIDGSGTVRGAQARTPDRLAAGARFGMQMHWGVPYKILNQVVEYEEGRRIAWRHFAGHVWRYILEPVDADSTRVTEQFDPSGSRAPFVLRLMNASSRNQTSIDATLDRLELWARAQPTKT